MNNAKMLTLEEIKNLPKASVIWRQEFYLDSDYDIEWFQLEPMLVCIPGEDGVLSWANSYSFLHLDIDDNLINNNRIFWDMEPDSDMTERGMSESKFNEYLERFSI